MKKTIYFLMLALASTAASAQNVKWTFQASGEIKPSSPAIGDDGTLYFGDYDSLFYAVTPAGTLKWQFKTGDRINSSASIGSNGVIYCGSRDFNMYAFNPDGTLNYTFPTAGSITYSTPAVDNDNTIYFGSDDGNVYAVDNSGTQKWVFSTGTAVRSSPAITSNDLLIVASNNDSLYALNLSDGSMVWAYNMLGNAEGAPALDKNDNIYIGVDQGGTDGEVISLDVNGSLRWTKDVVGRISVCAPALTASGDVIIGTKEGHNVLSLNPSNGNTNWNYMVDSTSIVNSSPAIDANGFIYFGTWDDQVHALTPTGALAFTVPTGGNIWSSPAIDNNGVLYIGSYDRLLYAIQTPASGLAASDWPMKGQNLKHTANMSSSIGISEIENITENVSVSYHNGELTIFTEVDMRAFSLDITDMSGKKIMNTTIRNTSGLNHTERINLNSGVYIISVQNDRKYAVKKIAISK